MRKITFYLVKGDSMPLTLFRIGFYLLLRAKFLNLISNK
jgi:hypothetical protein